MLDCALTRLAPPARCEIEYFATVGSGKSGLQVFYDAEPELLKKSAIALGFFDGVHPGHQVVIGKAVEEAKKIGATAGVVTFRDHPRALTRGQHPLLLTVIEQRLELFASLGVEATLVLTFSEDLCRLSPTEYVSNVLVGSMGARSISVGYNHHFGRDREGNPDLLKKIGQDLSFDVHVAPMVYVDGNEVSSSYIRELLAKGNMEEAKKMLSRPYAIMGEVVKGEGRGRTIGFPTANIKPRQFQMLPGVGVYAGRIKLDAGDSIDAVINIGFRPTFKENVSSAAAPVVEVHAFDFDRDIYDMCVEVEFTNFLRNEAKFDGVDALKRQILTDCQRARELLSSAEPEFRLPA